MHLDPGDDRAITGLVRVHGDLQVDGTTTTINSTVTTIDDPIITLGGDTAPSSDDNKDRGVEFRYYDSQARIDSLVTMILTPTSEDTSEDLRFYTTPQILQRSLVEQRQV